MNTMKLRKIGNSLGTTFSREVLQKAGLDGDEELEIFVSRGEITLRKAKGGISVEFSKVEADALAAGKFDTKAAMAGLEKVRKAVK